MIHFFTSPVTEAPEAEHASEWLGNISREEEIYLTKQMWQFGDPEYREECFTHLHQDLQQIASFFLFDTVKLHPLHCYVIYLWTNVSIVKLISDFKPAQNTKTIFHILCHKDYRLLAAFNPPTMTWVRVWCCQKQLSLLSKALLKSFVLFTPVFFLSCFKKNIVKPIVHISFVHAAYLDLSSFSGRVNYTSTQSHRGDNSCESTGWKHYDYGQCLLTVLPTCIFSVRKCIWFLWGAKQTFSLVFHKGKQATCLLCNSFCHILTGIDFFFCCSKFCGAQFAETNYSGI